MRSDDEKGVFPVGDSGVDSAPSSEERVVADSYAAKSVAVQAEQEIDPDRHDVLVVDEFENLYRFELNEHKTGFSPAQYVEYYSEGERKVIEVAGRISGRRVRRAIQGISGFALLPIREEPVSSFFCCYLVHTPFFGGQVEGVRLRRNEGDAFGFPLPARSNKGPTAEATPPQPLDARGWEGQSAKKKYTPRIALGRNPAGSEYTVDATLFDFVNPWTLANWSAAFDGKPVPEGRGTDPWGLLVQRGAVRWAFTVGETQVVEIGEGDVPESGVIGLLSDDVAFLNLDHIDQATDRLLVALPDGTVWRATLHADGQSSVSGPIDLKRAPEIWRLLRSGCVLGAVQVTADNHAARPLLLNLSTLKAPGQALKPLKEVAGTLDFKWPYPELTVRFVRPKTEIPKAGEIRDFISNTFAAWTDGSGLKVNVLVGEREELPSDVKTSHAARDEMPYDILISLDTLGTLDKTKSQRPRDVRLPTSELGAYALRRSYGSPTLWLGSPPDFQSHDGKPYFASDEFKHFVVHEVGHALGLPHLHQAPGISEILKGRMKPAGVIIEAVRAKYGLRLNKEFIEEEVLRTWAEREDDSFSVWPELRGGITSSVMFGLPGVSVFDGIDAPPLVASPTDFDRQWLRKVYP